jgi:hypothetical protein
VEPVVKLIGAARFGKKYQSGGTYTDWPEMYPNSLKNNQMTESVEWNQFWVINWGCRIFLGKKYQSGGKYTENISIGHKNIPNSLKNNPMAIKVPIFSLRGLPSIHVRGILVSKNTYYLANDNDSLVVFGSCICTYSTYLHAQLLKSLKV